MSDKPSFIITPIPKGVSIDKTKVKSIYLIGFIGDKIIATRNERGWDIPGGHLEEREEPIDGVRREVEEEAGVSFDRAIPYAILSLPSEETCMLFFASNSCKIGDFIPKPDAFERELIDVETLIERYHWDKNILRDLIEKAKESINVEKMG